MKEQINRREPGKPAFPLRGRPKLVLIPPAQEADRPEVKTELSREVKEMLREMNRRHIATRNTDTTDAA